MNKKTLHHLATGLGFLGLIGWFYAGRQLGILDWGVTLMPKGHEGAGLMLAICLMMLPGFFLWSRYNRLIEQKLNIKGKYYEDDYYQAENDLKK